MMEQDQVREKAAEIISHLTPEQKLAQLTCMFSGSQIPPVILHRFENGVGEIAVMPGSESKEERLAAASQEQDIVMSHCKIPAIRHNEAVTGQMDKDSTIFPSAIGLGATWNPDTVQQMADLIRQQMVAVGVRQALSPVMDVARDPRWGRMGETYGENPTLCAAMSVAYTKGLQGEDLKDGVLATGKHFLGYGMSEGGLNMASNPIPERELREVYAKPFQAAITEAGLASVMNSYGVIDGEMVIASENILMHLLREEMGFDGLVVSDYMSINKMTDLKISESPETAGVQALKAGLDVELPTPYGYRQGILALIDKDKKAKDAFDRAVQKVIEAKLKLGLFENPTGDHKLMDKAYDPEKSKEITAKAARESIVLLKNDGILPIGKEKKKIAVIGPHADSIRLLFGCYTYPAVRDRDICGAMSDMPGMANVSKEGENPNQMPYFEGTTIRGTSPLVEQELRKTYDGRTKSILQAIKDCFADAEVTYAKGCEVAGYDRSGFEAALDVVKEADVAIVVGGGKYGWGSNCTVGEGIDTDKIGLPGVQEELAEMIADTDIPAIYVHLDARPLSSEMIYEKYQGILEIWYPGENGGQALSEVLSGEYNPAGRMPVTVLRNAGQVPMYCGQKNGSGYHGGDGMVICKYVEGKKTPLAYLGEGLSYTKFEYSDLTVTEEANSHGSIDISCIITNIGKLDGEEVAQLYIIDHMSSMVRPAKELAGFCRVFIKAGESRKIRFTMRVDQTAFLNQQMEWLVEAGKMTVQIGSSSEDVRLSGQFTITDSAVIDGKTRGFYAKSRIEES